MNDASIPGNAATSPPPCILFTVDSSPLSETALDSAVDLARRFDLRVHVLLVVDGHNAHTIEQRAEAESLSRDDYLSRYLDDLAGRVPHDVLTSTSLAFAIGAADAITDAATELTAQLIVMASHGRSGLSRLLLGSVAETVIRHSSVPVAVIPVSTTDGTIRHGPHPQPVPAG